MKKIVTVRRILHHSVWRYGMFFEYEQHITRLVRSLPGVRYSGTFRCWYLDETRDNLQIIRNKFSLDPAIELRLESPDISPSDDENPLTGKRTKEDEGLVSMDDALFNDMDISGPDGYPGITTVKPDPGDIDKQHKKRLRYDPVIFTIDENGEKLIIKFTGRYDQEWIRELRSYGRLWFDKFRKDFVLDWSRMAVDSLSDYFSARDVEVIIRKNKVAEAVRGQRAARSAEIRERALNDAMLDDIEKVRRYMETQRYSKRTIGAYISLLGLFFRYFLPRNPSDITEDDIADFFHEQVFKQGYSSSYQNQVISAIKIYFSINRPGGMDLSLLDRPRKSRPLPKVFSKEEVRTILNSTRNIKHKLLLWMIYSCGLRRSEAVSIRLRDLDRKRGILNIVEAKGNIDRIVPVPVKVWEKIDEYMECYHPSFWLFEGQTGGRYSTESVYRVFKQALRNAGIRKDVGVHSLRHSYATHLHESGLDIRYIQELLGHKSTKTTEIYTHVSRRNLVSIRSPIEDIDLI